MNHKLKTPEMDRFFRAVLSLRTEKECYAFFEDICTVSELLAIAQRLEVAKMLSEDARYQDICDKTGASSATVSRVNRALHYGEDGYALVLERIKNESEDGSANRHE